MTTKELDNYLKRLEQLYRDNKITLDEGKIWIKVQKLLFLQKRKRATLRSKPCGKDLTI